MPITRRRLRGPTAPWVLCVCVVVVPVPTSSRAQTTPAPVPASPSVPPAIRPTTEGRPNSPISGGGSDAAEIAARLRALEERNRELAERLARSEREHEHEHEQQMRLLLERVARRADLTGRSVPRCCG